jgi:predicted nucleic acid-binding protein
MAFVIDASATLPWRFEDEATLWTEGLLNRVEGGEEVRVPAHWPLEVLNGLLMAERRNRVTHDQIREFVDDLAALRIRLEPAHSASEWLTILLHHGLAVTFIGRRGEKSFRHHFVQNGRLNAIFAH